MTKIFPNTNFRDALEELPIARRADMKFQMDGASVHTAAIINNWLDKKFRRKWIGRYSQEIKWPPRSPDLRLLDFYLWGKLKENVYRTRPNIEELKWRIRLRVNFSSGTRESNESLSKKVRKMYSS